MKRVLIVSLIGSILTVALAVPAFAAPPDDAPPNDAPTYGSFASSSAKVGTRSSDIEGAQEVAAGTGTNLGQYLKAWRTVNTNAPQP